MNTSTSFVTDNKKRKRKTAKSAEGSVGRYTLADLKKMKGKTDWAAVEALTDEEILAAIKSDPATELWTKEDFENATLIIPKQAVSIRLDVNVLEHFKSLGKGYQTRINNVLSEFVKAQQKKTRL